MTLNNENIISINRRKKLNKNVQLKKKEVKQFTEINDKL